MSESSSQVRHDEPGSSVLEPQLGPHIETPKVKPRTRKKTSPVMEESTIVAQIHSTPVRVHQSGRRSKNQNRHDRHRCHKSRNRSRDSDRKDTTNERLVKEISKLRNENQALNKKLNLSLTSLDSGLAQSEPLPPFDMDVTNAYQHLKNENERLVTELAALKSECLNMTSYVEDTYKENKILSNDIMLLKNLVYKLNVELEKYQHVEEGSNDSKSDLLPDNYKKNFLRPVLPLLKAYSGTIREKNELIETLEKDFKRFHTSFHEVMKENERLYTELSKKVVKGDDGCLEELKEAKRDLQTTRQEVEILNRQVALSKEKMQEVHAVYRAKVSETWKEKEAMVDLLQECRAELYTVKGKYSVLKQEFERAKLDADNRLPLAVHAASITECKRLFFDLKNEYDVEKRSLQNKIKELEDGCKPGVTQSRLRAENEQLKQRLAEVEGKDEIGGGELRETKKLLRQANQRADECAAKLAATKKQLHKAMAFAEDIVREQETLLLQLHAKQKENTLMTTHFGSLKKHIKSVEQGANQGLDSIEQNIRQLEASNSQLSMEVKRLEMVVKEKQNLIDELQPTRDSTS